MEQKIKFIILGLIVILIVSFSLNIVTIIAKQKLTLERNSLKQENADLTKRVEDGIRQNQDLQKRISLLNQNLDKLTQENDAFQKKYELVEKARAELVSRIQSLKKKSESSGAEETNPALVGEAYWAGVLKQKKDLEMQLETLRSDLKNVQIGNEQLEKGKNALELEVGSIKREKQDISRQYEFVKKQLGYNKKMMDTIALELVGEKNDKIQIQDALKLIKNENTILRRQLRSLNERKINLERKLADARTKNTTLESRFNEMDILLKDKVLQLDQVNKKVAGSAGGEQGEPVELSPIVVRPPSEASALQTSRDNDGKVLALNRENNFIVIDIGEENGVRVGDTFQVSNKEDKPIASVEVIETRDSISACDIKKESSTIKVGDKVRIK